MKESTENIFDTAIKSLNRMGIANENIIVTGSVALDILGVLPETHVIHDFDCIVNVEPEKLGLIKLVCEMFKSDKTPSCIEDDAKMVDINGIILNIWFNKPNEKSVVTYKGVGIKDMMSILNVKKSYCRSKDYKDINEIAKMILI